MSIGLTDKDVDISPWEAAARAADEWWFDKRVGVAQIMCSPVAQSNWNLRRYLEGTATLIGSGRAMTHREPPYAV